MMSQKKAVSPRVKAHFESLISKRISGILQLMYQRPDELVDIESGEKYICELCDIEHKRCDVEPDYRCELARKHETELKELELALSRLKNNTFGYCEKCSGYIGASELEKVPTATVCKACAGRV